MRQVDPLPFRANNDLEKALASRFSEIEVVGIGSMVELAAILSLPANAQAGPHLVLLPLEADCERLKKSLHFFDPALSVHVLPGFDVGVYSGLYPNRRLIAERVGWLARAQEARPSEIFIASAHAFLQYTIPYQVLRRSSFTLKVGEELPSEIQHRLSDLGYISSPIVEDLGAYSMRGAILDIFSPFHQMPVRLELFGDTIEAIRLFDPATQGSLDTIPSATIVPAQEILFTDDNREASAAHLRKLCADRPVDREEYQQLVSMLAQGQYFNGIEFLTSSFYETKALPVEHFSAPLACWTADPLEWTRRRDDLASELKAEFLETTNAVIRPAPSDVYCLETDPELPMDSKSLAVSRIRMEQSFDVQKQIYTVEIKTGSVRDFSAHAKSLVQRHQEFQTFIHERLSQWRNQGQKVFIACGTVSQSSRLQTLLQRMDFKPIVVDEAEFLWSEWILAQEDDPRIIHLLPHFLDESLRLIDESFILLRDEDFYGRKRSRREYKSTGTLEERTSALSFGDLKPGDLIVHKAHGVGVFEGLKVMPIDNVAAEFIQIKYKDNDRLYLPVYRIGQIQKFSGHVSPNLIDKLGGSGWEKTKTKVKNHLRDLASELLALYAKRAQVHRPNFSSADEDFLSFEGAFPYEETADQVRAINDVLKDLIENEKPMDRLICGDVGFGKTEIAMRAAFKAVQERKQVAVVAPTTVLTFQHLETFKKRFRKWPVEIRSLNRFVDKSEVKKTLTGLTDGTVDIVIGTHRLLSKDVKFKDLGLLIVDEEQKFGVTHKEKLRKLKTSVDTLTLSATPIPRTLNLSLMGLRDLSIINTPPVDRLPTRTFVCKFDPDTIRKAVHSEIARGGQVFFIHNRIQSIYGLADQLKEILPDVRMQIAHGQMEEGELEKTMLQFFNHEIDLLLCTAIVESGMDVPRANTMFIDNAQQFGLSQLYQLRGRVGRSKERAYCYLLIPNRKLDATALERLKVIQENTALGSGIRIAHHDLELRGAGDILGDEQSGHINAVGYELYLELLEEAIQTTKGETVTSEIEPEINVRIPALIPSDYMPDIRLRLSYYKALAQVGSVDDIDRIENELRDQFGKPPVAVLNLMGLMLIRKLCKDLAVLDLSGSKTGVTLMFTPATPLPTDKVIELTTRANKKYTLMPDNRLNVRINELTWPKIYDELVYLLSLCPKGRSPAPKTLESNLH